MCHVLKLLLTVIHKRIAQKIDSEISELQADFRKASGTRKAIFSLKILAEKHIEMQKDIYACFIDYSKAFDIVKHEKLIQAMRKTDIDPNDISLISHLYWTQKTKVRVGKDLSDEVDIKKGVRQGCVLSPSLFNLYTEIDDVPGLKVNGENINNLRLSDDTVLLAESEKGLQNIVTIIEEKSEQYGLMMNTKKTKVMVISKTEPPKVNIKVKGKCIEQIAQFKYLGQLITTDARSDDEIKTTRDSTRSTKMEIYSPLGTMYASVSSKTLKSWEMFGDGTIRV
ncbi:retrovirus-related Pol polyprotein from type-1 retrotransposable element R2 [Elysia marginata]|uniref:Retrovirus-related Pol polyprotein from type-1 retrotransposable element R2 n=1 Tax=Elysia marginata TaxID=1093978 RepID=A0AAV4IBX9_9GAST|nr:retrovirus-related Pol polyprotein from type-1 retrotransposable element R2 [Elysia marginata]